MENQNEKKELFTKVKTLKLPNRDLDVLICNILYDNTVVTHHSNKLFIFGDNIRRRGIGGQAIIRYYDNTFGFITKIDPNNFEESFITDANYEAYKKYVDKTIEYLKYMLEINIHYEYLVFPYTGLGNGLAKMPEKAPKCFEYLKEQLKLHFNYEF